MSTAIYLLPPVEMFPADTAGAEVFPAVQVVPLVGLQTQTVLRLAGVRLAGEPGSEVCRAPVQPDQGTTLEAAAQPDQTQVGPDRQQGEAEPELSHLSPLHHQRHELVLLAGVEGGHLAPSVETITVAVREMLPGQQAETNIAVAEPTRVTLLQTFRSGGKG